MSRRRWVAFTWAFLTAVWLSIFVRQTNFMVQLPHLLPPLPVVECPAYVPADLQVRRWLPDACLGVSADGVR